MFEKILVFTKAQLSAFIGGVTDYFVMILVTEVFHVYYVISIGIGGVVGALVNFNLNKLWTFHSKDKPYAHSMNVQLVKFIFVVINSILLKSGGTYIVTTYMGLDYKISRIIIDLFVSVIINYNLQRCWVFKKVN